MTLYRRRRLTNYAALTLAVGAAGIGLVWLIAILWTLVENGIGGPGGCRQRRPGEQGQSHRQGRLEAPRRPGGGLNGCELGHLRSPRRSMQDSRPIRRGSAMQ